MPLRPALSDTTARHRAISGLPPGRAGVDLRGLTALLRSAGRLARLRHEPLQWRCELLNSLLQIMPAMAAAAYTVKITTDPDSLQVARVVDAGFQTAARREAFHNPFSQAAFQRLFARLQIAATRGRSAGVFTVTRRDLMDDATWNASPIARRCRRAADIDDCLFSAARSRIMGDRRELRMMVICVFRSWEDPRLFSADDRACSGTIHAGFDWMYRDEYAGASLPKVATLPPGLHQVFTLLLEGRTQHQVAESLSKSVSAVRRDVKALYRHFGVTTRKELMAAEWDRQA